MKLTADICRCHDEQCALRNQCLRWLLRNTGTNRTPHADSMHDGERECGYFMEADE